jgi:hypothetical protein
MTYLPTLFELCSNPGSDIVVVIIWSEPDNLAVGVLFNPASMPRLLLNIKHPGKVERSFRLKKLRALKLSLHCCGLIVTNGRDLPLFLSSKAEFDPLRIPPPEEKYLP